MHILFYFIFTSTFKFMSSFHPLFPPYKLVLDFLKLVGYIYKYIKWGHNHISIPPHRNIKDNANCDTFDKITLLIMIYFDENNFKHRLGTESRHPAWTCVLKPEACWTKIIIICPFSSWCCNQIHVRQVLCHSVILPAHSEQSPFTDEKHLLRSWLYKDPQIT